MFNETVQIGSVLRNAVVFDVKNWSGDAMNADSLLDSVDSLFELLERRGANYTLVGGIALLRYVDGRNTEDIDIIMALSSLETLPEIKVTSKDMYFARGKYGELQIDILLTDNPLFQKIQNEYSTINRFLDRDISFATVDGLLLLKLYALPSLYRQGNFARVGIYENDIATLMHDYAPDMASLTQELASYTGATDLEEIKSIVSEIEQRIERFQKGMS